MIGNNQKMIESFHTIKKRDQILKTKTTCIVLVTAILIGLLVGIVPVRLAQAQTLAPKWSVAKSYLNETSSISQISCPSRLFCMAFGSVSSGGLIDYTSLDSGMNWEEQSFPSYVSGLWALSCPSVGFCTALGGDHGGSPISISTTDSGATWTKTILPIGASGLSALSCASDMVCVAVGGNYRSVPGSGVAISTSNGGVSWTMDSLPSGTPDLNTVSCATTLFCAALGSFGIDLAAAGQTITDVAITTSDGGSTWSTGSVPSNGVELSRMSCVTIKFCVAIGNGSIEWSSIADVDLTFDGGLTWNEADLSTPLNLIAGYSYYVPFRGLDLSDVSCTISGSCKVVGEFSDLSSRTNILLTTSDYGSSWHLGTLPSAANKVSYMSCPIIGSFCEMVGTSFDGKNLSFATEDGGTSWTQIPFPSGIYPLQMVSCATKLFCMAANGANNGNIATTADGGSTWHTASAPLGLTRILGISCSAVNLCMIVAIGNNNFTSIQLGVIATTTDGGVTWSIVNHYLLLDHDLSISCIAITTCIIVSSGTNSTVMLTTFDFGGTWSQESLPSPNYGILNISSISCVPPSFCALVNVEQGWINPNLVEIITTTDGGLSWTIHSVPSGVSSLSEISCATSSFCVAVGNSNTNGAVALSTTDGGVTWTLDTIPSGVSSLSDVSCATPSFCVATGSSNTNGAVALSTSDGGVTWVSDSLPPQVASLSGVSCVSSTMCVSVGSGNTSLLGSLILEIGPHVSGVSPNNGSSLGGSTVDIHGSGFSGATSVDFGSSPGSNVNVVSDNEITATSPPGVGSVDITVVGPNGSSPISSLDSYTYVSYSPISPTRVCDTRPVGIGTSSNQCNTLGNHTLGNAETLSVQVAGNGYPVPGNATSVVLNVTATNETSGGYLTVFPSGQSQPIASNLNFGPNETVANLVEVGVGSNGDISIFNFSQSTDVIVDVEGYSAPVALSSGTGLMEPLFPYRVCDTRPVGSSIASNPCNTAPNKTLASGSKLDVNVSSASVPSDANAVIVNITVTNTASSGYLTAWQGPSTTNPPVASNLNFGASETVANRVIVPLNMQTGDFTLYVFGSAADVIVDVNGYITGSSATLGNVFNPMSPTRICDSRVPNGVDTVPNQCDTNGNSTLGPNSSEVISIPASTQVPSDATALAINVTVTNTTAPGFLSIYPTTSNLPIASDLNWSQGETRANLAVIKLGVNNTITVYNLSGSADLIIDLEGWYS